MNQTFFIFPGTYSPNDPGEFYPYDLLQGQTILCNGTTLDLEGSSYSAFTPGTGTSVTGCTVINPASDF